MFPQIAFQSKADHPRLLAYSYCLLLWPWPWSNDLDIQKWPRYSEDTPAHEPSNHWAPRAWGLQTRSYQTHYFWQFFFRNFQADISSLRECIKDLQASSSTLREFVTVGEAGFSVLQGERVKDEVSRSRLSRVREWAYTHSLDQTHYHDALRFMDDKNNQSTCTNVKTHNS